MSEFHVTCFKIDNIEAHPDADRLELINVFGGYPCCVQKGKYKIGDLAVYIPVDVTLPDREEFSFLESKDRKHLKAKKIRGIFSMGLIIDAPENVKEDDELSDYFGITRYEPVDQEENVPNGDNEKDPHEWDFVKYTDIESGRKQKHQNCFQYGEEIVLHEKLDGQNYRIVWRDDKLWVGSRKCNKRLYEDNPSSWWKLAFKYDLHNKLKHYPDLQIFGEEYGTVQTLKYDLNERKLSIFDIYDTNKQQYLDYDDARKIAKELDLPWVPELFRGEYTSFQDLMPLAEGQSTIANHIREGFVMRPIHERYDHRLGRVIIKVHGEAYLLFKGKLK